MQSKMPWLKDRLTEVGKTPAALARELKIQPPRVYEMIGGRRAMQPDEITPTARFLDWTVDQLLDRLPPGARVLPAADMAQSHKGEVPVLSTLPDDAKSDRAMPYDCVLAGDVARWVQRLPAWEGRDDISCLYLHSVAMVPWRDPGDLIAFEATRPPRETDHVVLYMILRDNQEHTPVIVRQLIQLTKTKLRVRQHSPAKEYEIDRKSIAHMYRVMGWDDCIR